MVLKQCSGFAEGGQPEGRCIFLQGLFDIRVVRQWEFGVTKISRMPDTLPPCPQCSSEYTYELDALLVCPECAHEWNASAEESESIETVIKDAVGNVLQDGDTVSITKTMKVKGAQSALKAGTKVRNIRLTPGSGDHDIAAKVDGFGQMELKSSIVKKI